MDSNNRSSILATLIDDIFGPSDYHKINYGAHLEIPTLPISTTEEVEIAYEDLWKNNYHEDKTGNSILCGGVRPDEPIARYSTGILYPSSRKREGETEYSDEERIDDSDDEQSEPFFDDEDQEFQDLDIFSDRKSNTPEDFDFEIKDTSTRRQSSASISFCLNKQKDISIELTLTGGRYEKLSNIYFNEENGANPLKKKAFWWVRKPEKYLFKLHLNDLFEGVHDLEITDQLSDVLRMEAKIYLKKIETEDQEFWTGTISIINSSFGNQNEFSLFQSHLELEIFSQSSNLPFRPYPKISIPELENEIKISGLEDSSMIDQLYVNQETFGIGHGCSAVWEKNKSEEVLKINGVFVPVYLLKKVNPDIRPENSEGRKIEMPKMEDLSKSNTWEKGLESIDEVISFYEKWIHKNEQISQTNPLSIKEKLIFNCKKALERIKKGRSLLDKDDVQEVFMMMNSCMLQQQKRSLSPKRFADKNKNNDIIFPKSFVEKEGRGSWRAFQICFILANLNSFIDPQEEEERNLVDLIWFPTGGGKTEAYLGLAAFSILWRRLNNNSSEGGGTDVLMRYTLRLLTSQQFQRASTLICALERLRKNNPQTLGEERISLGIFVGGDASPNTESGIRNAWSDLSKVYKSNKFVVTSCPWCSAEMGRTEKKENRKHISIDLGYTRDGNKSNPPLFHCPDNQCDFSRENEPAGLPLYVDDISIIKTAPTMIIATIDKFAVIPWKRNFQNIFGLDEKGNRIKNPPSLIIQDELHLISQSLGSIAGLWEGIVDYFSTDQEKKIKPKIICSTATIKEYKEQILNLYARENSSLFPPPGLTIEDSFFGSYDEDLNNAKMFVGICSPNDGSALTTQKRVFTALGHAPLFLNNDIDSRDPWWTNVSFFNSIRELNNAETILQSDFNQYAKAYTSRFPYQFINRRSLSPAQRLTGEKSSDDVARILDRLSIQYGNKNPNPINFCVATSILEVGVDVDRLSLMTVIGQPKTTSTYIQATGRVGRSKPGLVVTVYNPFKPRDVSHFENFSGYHGRLYSEVEPTSVTPFTSQALIRVLHSIIASFLMMKGNSSPRPYQNLEESLDDFKDFFIRRIKHINNHKFFQDKDWLQNFEDIFNKRCREMKVWNKDKWVKRFNEEGTDSLIISADDKSFDNLGQFWPTMLNMRSVDPESRLDITGNYREGIENE